MAIYSCLAYPGSKRKVVDLIMEKLPDGITDWREPFFGSGSVTIAFLQSPKSKDCKRIIVGDLYSEVWAFWKATQQDPKQVIQCVNEMFYKWCPHHDELVNNIKAYESGEEYYVNLYDIAKEEATEFWKWSQDDETTLNMNLYERAARFFIVNHISFSSMSDSGTLSMDRFTGFNVAPREESILAVSELLQRVEILNAPFQETMANIEESSFIFLDPPYIAQEASGLYGKKGSTHKKFPHLELAKLCLSYKPNDCKWLMTIDDSIRSRQLYAGAFIESFYIPYTMACNSAEDALAGEEIFISNYKISESASFDALNDLL